MKSSVASGKKKIFKIASDDEDDGKKTDLSTQTSGVSEWPPTYRKGATIVVPLSEVEFRTPVESDEDKLKITFLDLLGVGFDGVVYKVSDNLSNQISALKVFKRTCFPGSDDYDADGTRKEISLLRRVDHPHVLSFKATFQNSSTLCLMTEFCKYGSWLDFIRIRKTITEVEGKVLFVQLLSAVRYLHSIGIVHRDLWAANILLTDTADSAGISLKVADFGSAVRCQFDDQGLKLFQNDLGKVAYFLEFALDLPNLTEENPGRSEELRDLWNCLRKHRRQFNLIDFLNHPWLTSSLPFPKRIPISAIEEAPQFPDLGDETSNQLRMELFKELALDGLISDQLPRSYD